MSFKIGANQRIKLNIRTADKNTCALIHELAPANSETTLWFSAREALILAQEDQEQAVIQRAQLFLELWKKLCVKVEGYETADGKDIMSADNWKDVLVESCAEHILEVMTFRNRIVSVGFDSKNLESASPGFLPERPRNAQGRSDA